MFQRSKNFCKDNHGSFAMVFALAFPAMAVGVGAAIDYSAASGTRSSLQSSTDAGALTAARAFTSNGGNKSAAEAAGLAALRANFEVASGGRSALASSRVVMTVNDPPTFAAASSVNVKNKFSGYVSGGASSVSAEAVAQVKTKGGSTPTLEEVPTDLIIAMDVSASMGLAASLDDRNKMVAAVTSYVRSYGGAKMFETCAFACHDTAWTPSGPKTTLDIARENKIKLRFDVEKELIINTIDTMLKGDNKKDHRISVFKFAEKLTLVHDLSNKKSDIEKAVKLVDFESVGTLYEVVFADLRTKISEMISSKKLRPEANKTLLIMTDGMRTKPWLDNKTEIYAIKESSCNFFKTMGIKVAIIELKYLPQTVTEFEDYTYMTTQFPLISPALKSCASSDALYGQAENTIEIVKEFDRVMKGSITASTKMPVLIK
jgi:Flp pilus assembly protein TadG